MITLRSGKVLASGASAPSAVVPPVAARVISPSFLPEKEKNERKERKAREQPVPHPPSSSSLARPLRWQQCKLPSKFGPCCRKYFLAPCLRGISRRLSVGSRFSVEWERFGDVQISNAIVLHRSSPTEVRVRYDNLRGVWPFPPHDAHTFVRRVALPKVTRNHLGINPSAVASYISRFASPGGIVRLQFRKGSSPSQRWVGVVVEKRNRVCRIRWFGVGPAQSDSVLWFLAPRRAEVVVEKVYFAPAPPPGIAQVKSAALRRQQFTELLHRAPQKTQREVSTATGGDVPGPSDRAQTSEPAKKGTNIRYGFLTLNARSLTDDARLYSAIALAHAREVGIIVLCETKRRVAFDPVPEWTVYETPANEAGQMGLRRASAQLPAVHLCALGGCRPASRRLR